MRNSSLLVAWRTPLALLTVGVALSGVMAQAQTLPKTLPPVKIQVHRHYPAPPGITPQFGTPTHPNFSAYKHRLRMKPAFGAATPPAPDTGGPRLDSVTPLASNPPPPPVPVDGPLWEFIGPRNLPTGAFDQGAVGPPPVSGRVNAVAYDPNNPNVYYLASAGGGLWKSVDKGINWLPLTDNKTSVQQLAFSSIVVDPANSQTIYAGTGDYDGGSNSNLDATTLGYGVLKSTDGGATWTNLDSDHTVFGVHCVRSILIDPANSQHLLVAAGRDTGYIDIDLFPAPNGGIFSSSDGGQTWTNVLNIPFIPAVTGPPAIPFSGGFVSSLVYNADHTAIYAGVDFVGVYKSIDNGQTWTQLALDLTPGTNPNPYVGGAYRVDVAASPVFPNKIYVQAEAVFYGVVDGFLIVNGSVPAILRSLDGGNSFQDVTGTSFFSLLTLYFNQPEDYHFYLACGSQKVYPNGSTTSTPVISDTIYSGGLDILQMVDKGGSVSDTANTLTFGTAFPNQAGALMYTDQHGFAINPRNSNEMLVGNDGGVYRFVYSPVASQAVFQPYHFANLNKTLGLTQIYGADYHPLDPTHMITGAQDVSTPLADGDLFNWLNPTSADGFATAVSHKDPLNTNLALRGPNRQYLSWYSDIIFRTDNDWATIIDISPNTGSDVLPFLTVLALDQATPRFLYTGTTHLYKYDHDNTAVGTWTGLGQQIGKTNQNLVTAIAVAPQNSNYLFAAADDDSVWFSNDAGTTWLEIDQIGLPGGLPPGRTRLNPPKPDLIRYVSSITVSNATPDNTPRRIYATITGQNQDGTPVISHIYRCDNFAQVDPVSKKSVAVWQPLDSTGLNALPDVPVTSLAIPYQDEQTIYAGTTLGVFMTTDGGANWTDATGPLGLPSVQINKLDFVPGTGYLMAATFGRGMWRLPIGNDTPIRIYPQLQYYRGNKARLPVTVEVFTAGQDPALSIPVEVRSAKMTAAGWININVSSHGTYDIYVTVRGFLRRKIRSVSLPLNGALRTPLMYAGDVNGDNVIDGTDIAAIRSRLGQYYNGPEDIDGDGRITVRDLNIAYINNGRRGD